MGCGPSRQRGVSRRALHGGRGAVVTRYRLDAEIEVLREGYPGPRYESAPAGTPGAIYRVGELLSEVVDVTERFSIVAARDRLAALESEIRDVDAALKAGADTAALERRRAALERDFDQLYEAVEFVSETMPKLRTCVCGKVCHPDEGSALAHARALETVRVRRPAPTLNPTGYRRRVSKDVSAYVCMRNLKEVWHVGHHVLKA